MIRGNRPFLARVSLLPCFPSKGKGGDGRTSLENTFSSDTLLGTERVTGQSESISKFQDSVGLSHTLVPYGFAGRDTIVVDTLERGWWV